MSDTPADARIKWRDGSIGFAQTETWENEDGWYVRETAHKLHPDGRKSVESSTRGPFASEPTQPPETV